jgi:very-short-patch-repair endonuclease
MRRLDDEVDIAELTHRLITRPQLSRLGYTPKQIRFRVAVGLLCPVFDGVYCLDPGPFDFLTKAIALCLRYRDGFLAGGASSHYWGLRRGVPNLYEFCVPEGTCRPRGAPFALVRYTSFVGEGHVRSQLDGLRVSSPARSVFESASRLDEFGLRSMIQAGLNDRLFTREELATTGRELCTPGRRGTRLFRLVTEEMSDEAPTDSEEELILLDALRATDLPEITPQYPLLLPNGTTVHLDVAVPAGRLDLEVDGPTHDDPIAVHRDKSRDLQVSVTGWLPMRIPAIQIRRQLRAVTAAVLHVARQRISLLAAHERG